MDRVVRGASVYLTSKPIALPPRFNRRSSSVPVWVAQKYASRLLVRAIISSMTKPSREAPSLGWPCEAARSEMVSNACNTPLSRMYTLGDLTWRFLMFACQG